MTETKPLDDIIQRLDALSLEQLLEARTKIDSLIQSKYTLMNSKDLLNIENIRKDNIPVSLYRDILAKLKKITDSAMNSKDLLNIENIRKDNIPVSVYRDVYRDILAKLKKITDSAMNSKDLLNIENIRKDNIPVSVYRDVCLDILEKLEKITDSVCKISNYPSVNDSLGSIRQSSLPKTEDDSLKDVIELVNGWMADESGYDEETYPQVEAGLNHNRLSL